MEDARREGLSREDYAEVRRRELVMAMEALGAEPELRCLWHPDKESILHAAAILDQLTEELAEADVVITHAYEFGHPDHDTAALCTRLALDRVRARTGRGVPLFEFPIYAILDGEPAWGRFMPDEGAPETVLPMSEADRARRLAALKAFHTQRELFRWAGDWDERLRPAPRYDFRRPAPHGVAWYDRHHWGMTSEIWREHADAILDREGA
jgi:LmbE family N-acetylglucosaminyl deacetylase